MVSSDSRYPDWESVYQDNAKWVYRTIYARVGNRADAEDLTAEVFLAALRPLRLTASAAEVRSLPAEHGAYGARRALARDDGTGDHLYRCCRRW
ncbi:hypothetical protein MAUB1S_01707 [Mycolicibacterium aubagnense]